MLSYILFIRSRNFGTVIRHRSKFVIILIILAAPKILKLIFKKTENNYKVNKT